MATDMEAVVAQAIRIGNPLNFTHKMERLAAGDAAGEFQFEADMLTTFFKVCDSTSLAMQSAKLLLNSRFKTSESFQDWCDQRNLAYLESSPEYQKYAPKLELALSQMTGNDGFPVPPRPD